MRIHKLLFISVVFLISSAIADNYLFVVPSIGGSTVLPTLANGHIGLQIFSDSILINGLYNGRDGNSHRARIPNHSNIQIGACQVPIKRESEFVTNNACSYTLNSRNGLLEATHAQATYTVTHRLYIHRFYDRAIVNEFTITRVGTGNSAIEVPLFSDHGGDSVDTYLKAQATLTINSKAVRYFKGRTYDSENYKYQLEYRQFSVYSHTVPESIVLAVGESEKTFRYITTVDYDDITAQNELRTVDLLPNPLTKHVEEWEALWKRFEITIEGNDELDRSIINSIFFLASSLPSLTTNYPKNKFYGLSPSGLGRGGVLLAEYQGHSFWDTEMWMHPPILLLHPNWSQDILNYRYEVREVAMDNANETGYDGIRYPWESAYTGKEVTPVCCPEVVRYQHHITADVAFAARSHLYATHDMEWMQNEGCELAVGTAKFWASHVTYDAGNDAYDIKNIMGPDEDKWGVDNNPYTNVVAGYNLYFGEFASCVCKEVLNMEDYEVLSDWSEIASKLKLLYDPEMKYNPQYEGFKNDHEIKQADTILLAYPLQYQMDAETISNNLHIYEEITRETGPAMTWAMHVVGHLDVGDVKSAAALYDRSFVDYIRKPFYIWSEVLEQYEGAGNFITGAGGFLQSIINGYGGVRLFNDTLYVVNSRLPPKATKMTFAGITYLESIFSVEVTATTTKVEIKEMGSIALAITKGEVVQTVVQVGSIFEIAVNEKLEIKAKDYAFRTCSLPADQIKTFEFRSSSASSVQISGILLAVVVFLLRI